MATPSKDRRGAVIASTTLNGIDFVEIANADQKTLRVHFLNGKVNPKGKIDRAEITGGEVLSTVAVQPIQDADWSADAAGRPLLTLHAVTPGDFCEYTLTLVAKVPPGPLDLYFSSAQFSFKALCDSQLDCETPPPPCPTTAADLPPIDYLAKDFLSFRNALSDFSALRYPEWVERSEADLGMMFLEALANVADELSYTQDRIAAEATIETATERRSLVRLARLVDYEPRPATAARVLLQFDVDKGPIKAGLAVSAPAPDCGTIFFETGTGLSDTTLYPASKLWNSMTPYWFDDSQRCLAAGSTSMWLVGKNLKLTEGLQLLIDTPGLTPVDPPVRQVVTLTKIEEEVDPISFLNPPGGPTDVTRISWGQNDALTAAHDQTRTTVKGNLVPATQGRRVAETFAIDTPPLGSEEMPLAVVRLGPNSSPPAPVPRYLYTLGNSPLAWLAQDAPDSSPLPEIRLQELPHNSLPVDWIWRSSLLEAERFENGFTVDPARYSGIARGSDGRNTFDYDGDAGDTIRFGDGIFGQIPESAALFQVTYRFGGGAAGNVAADSITRLESPGAIAVTNPFPAAGGQDAETLTSIRRLAPQAFRAKQFRAVVAKDYQTAAESLSWVQRAGTAFRWTGSWLTVFTTVDPQGSEQIPSKLHTEVIDLLNRYRLAGYESYAPSPKFVALDLIVSVCAQPGAFQGDLQAGVLKALSTAVFPDGSTGFFNFDRFTFGTPLERSRLEAAVQEVPGAAGVFAISYRRRGLIPSFVAMPDIVQVGFDEIVRVDNDPSRPERGSLQVIVKGGK
ncbi:MAG TPA: baseplate J/gp47 family protein [Bryobacteraceae bacterium]